MSEHERRGGADTPVEARRRPARTQRTQLKLFEAAMIIMSEKGPTATTVDEVAERAGVAKGTVYYNFGSKKQMVEGLLAYGIQLVLDAIGEAGRGVEDPRERLERGVLAALDFLEENPGFARLAVAEIWRPGVRMSEGLAGHRSRLLDRVQGMVEDLGERYELPAEPDARSLAVGIFGSTFMLAMDREMQAASRPARTSARIVMAMVDGYVLGLRKAGPGRR